MSVLAQPLPDDPEALKAMLLAERAAHVAETERLKQIIKELQRHRFGRRAESLPIDQLELALGDKGCRPEMARRRWTVARRSPRRCGRRG